jgi:hypothetical protein
MSKALRSFRSLRLLPVLLAVALAGALGTTAARAAGCPCSLFGNGGAPDLTHLVVGTNGGNPDLELGVKIQVTEPVDLIAVRFYKDDQETGFHAGTVWASDGTLLGQTFFASESGSGWQEQALGTPVRLVPGKVYVVSVGFNNTFVDTHFGLETQITNGPLQSVADGANGVFADQKGNFPDQTFASSNYFIDAVVTPATGPPATPRPENRYGFCSAPGNTWPDGTPIAAGTFLNLPLTQPLTDKHYAGAVPAYYVQDIGITCSLTPSQAALAASSTQKAGGGGDVNPYAFYTYVPNA